MKTLENATQHVDELYAQKEFVEDVELEEGFYSVAVVDAHTFAAKDSSQYSVILKLALREGDTVHTDMMKSYFIRTPFVETPEKFVEAFPDILSFMLDSQFENVAKSAKKLSKLPTEKAASEYLDYQYKNFFKYGGQGTKLVRTFLGEDEIATGYSWDTDDKVFVDSQGNVVDTSVITAICGKAMEWFVGAMQDTSEFVGRVAYVKIGENGKVRYLTQHLPDGEELNPIPDALAA